MAGYSGTPLARKLGAGPGTRVLLDGAPADFTLDAPGADVSRRLPRSRGTAADASGGYDLILCFCPDLARLVRRWPVLHPLTTPAGALWIAWPKRASGIASDLDDNVVRGHALAHGRVDVKICAIDEVWSGMKHVIRLADRPHR